MRRVVVEKPGGLEALRLIEEPEPAPAHERVAVRVTACGVNFADVVARMGHYEAAKGLYPLTPGFEFCGRTPDGRRVIGITRFGGYASALTAAPEQLWPAPEDWTDAECAGFPAVFLTAYHGLFHVAKVSAGETLLVHSAAGGVGLALVQLGKLAGCRVVGVVGSEGKKKTALEFGADEVIVRTPRLWPEIDRATPQGFDAVFDANGVSTPRPGFERLKPLGRLVVYGFAEILPRDADKPSLARLAWNWLRVPKFSPLEMTTTNRAVMGFNVVFLFHRLELAGAAMTRMLGWAAEGKLKPLPTTTFPLERAADAHAALESGRTTGKLVLTVCP